MRMYTVYQNKWITEPDGRVVQVRDERTYQADRHGVILVSGYRAYPVEKSR